MRKDHCFHCTAFDIRATNGNDWTEGPAPAVAFTFKCEKCKRGQRAYRVVTESGVAIDIPANEKLIVLLVPEGIEPELMVTQ